MKTETPVGLENIIYPSVVTLIAAAQLVFYARRVGIARTKNRVYCPKTTGDVAFERTFRAQQNTLEFFPIFMTFLWLSSLFFCQVMSSVVALGYLASRHLYFRGYTNSVPERITGYKLGRKCLMVMGGMAVIGVVNAALRIHTCINLAEMMRKFAKSHFNINL